MTFSRIYFITPSFRPVGGVVKILDYVEHARSLGIEAVLVSPHEYSEDLPLFRLPRFAHLTPKHELEFRVGIGVALRDDELAYFSWPTHYQQIEARLGRHNHLEQVVHIVQNVRHANPMWTDGYALRLLSRPMTRIMTNDVVLAACEPHLNRRSLTQVIPLGIDAAFFRRRRRGGWEPRPLRVGYTTWKSSVGDEVAAALGEDTRFEFRAIREYVDWDTLRALYHWCDVFLGTPNVEEGFYMPALEAMAAGAVVIVADAGGNRAFCRFGENCLVARLDDAASYVAALRTVVAWDEAEVVAMRTAGYDAVTPHTLRSEREGFARLLADLGQRLDAAPGEARPVSPRSGATTNGRATRTPRPV